MIAHFRQWIKGKSSDDLINLFRCSTQDVWKRQVFNNVAFGIPFCNPAIHLIKQYLRPSHSDIFRFPDVRRQKASFPLAFDPETHIKFPIIRTYVFIALTTIYPLSPDLNMEAEKNSVDRYSIGYGLGSQPDQSISFISTHPFTDMRASFFPMCTAMIPASGRS